MFPKFLLQFLLEKGTLKKRLKEDNSMKFLCYFSDCILNLKSKVSAHEKRGIFFMLLGMFLFTSVNALLKTLHNDYSIVEVVYLRNIYALFPMTLFLMRQQQSFSPAYIKTHAVRGILGSFGHILLFSSLFMLPLSLANILSFMTTFVVCVLASFWLKEKLFLSGWMAIFIGFIGVFIIVNPFQKTTISSFSFFSGVLCALAACFFEGGIMVHNRVFSKKESPERMVFFYAVVASFFMGGILLFCTFIDLHHTFFSSPFMGTISSSWVSPTLHDQLIFLCFGIGGGLGQICITRAYAYTHSYILAPLIYTAIIWSTFYGVMFFQESLTLSFYGGAILIIGAGLFILLKRP